MKKKISVEDVLARLPPASRRDYVVNLVDHRGRKFIQSFYVDRDKFAPDWFVWGTSNSGAKQIVARPIAARCRNRSGARVRPGWSEISGAQDVATLMSLHAPALTARSASIRSVSCGAHDPSADGVNGDRHGLAF
jgi:hypothetical protein